ncbi:MAG: CaiB/BaiF CoA-transferase family protein, partial [Candidatus Bathyarchaeota archaeon]
LQVRECTGLGQQVDVALVDSVYASLENLPQRVFAEDKVPGRIGNRYEFVYPYDSFKARDGWVIIGIANDTIWERFIEASGLHALACENRFSSNPLRVENYMTLKPLIQAWVSTNTVEKVVSYLNHHGVPACPIYDIKQVSHDPHIGEARGMTVEIDQPRLGKVRLTGNPVKMSATNPSPRGPAPRLGGDTEGVLKELLGLSDEDIKWLEGDDVF